ncbi:MAG: DNA-directed RNA polymerase subunit A' [Caldisphaeraceae archaeon]|nr:DNA-directed RNA polymerase subunit A' [Caldisphaeraceae archaeon]MEB3691846.1 DNA-directed RNA polymerase subunit A' [Caldisphaeraceae archaeon]MEB3798112.1 DNA-directed RNA polymerase subunit A' [Caldisphaeraceae archaeon]
MSMSSRSMEKYVIDKIHFRLISPLEIRKMAKITVVRPEIYEADGSPVSGGLRDPHFGAIEPGERCPVCGNTREECPGHFGKIDLSRPVILPHLGEKINLLLQSTCRNCGRILLPEDRIAYLTAIYKKLKEKWPLLAQNFSEEIAKQSSSITECPHCGAKQYKIKFIKPFTFYEVRPEGEIRLTPSEIRERLEALRDEDIFLLGMDPKSARPEWSVLTVLPVPPLAVRPSITMENGLRAEDDLTHALVEIVRQNERLKNFLSSNAPESMVEEAWQTLQNVVAAYIDNELPNIYQLSHRGRKQLKTLAQRLKGKEGRLRGNLSGKRVNFSARTVISPDPYISIDEVGVPIDIAKILTVSMVVTSYNIDEAREYILNGPYKWPGAMFVYKRRQNMKIDLRYHRNYRQLAESLEIGDIVERHLIDGDIVLFNRQPSLHRMSIMAHKVKVMPGKTFRLNLLDCPPYNADFDGDEMNLHVPRLEEARAEAESLMLVENQILSPRYGGPIIGGRQDYISGSYLLTVKTSLFRKEEVSYILAAANYSGKLPEPAIIKPEPLWTGKQLISLFLPKGFRFEGRAKINAGELRCDDLNCFYDSYIVVSDGKLLMGVFDKNAIGAEQPGNILHYIVLEFGSKKAREFLDNVFRMFIRMLEVKGFSISLAEIEIPQEAKDKVAEMVHKAKEDVQKIIDDFRQGRLELVPGRTAEESLELKIIQRLQKLRDETGRLAIGYMDVFNNAFIMARTGARGSDVNITQMAVMLGQQIVRGKRISRGFRKHTLSQFKSGDLSPEARGFVIGNFRDGLKPYELFFHASGGREGLVDTAVKTSQSGYMQRRLINALQDLYVSYDGTVRDSADNVIQFRFGEDGVDPTLTYHGKSVDIDRIISKVKVTGK